MLPCSTADLLPSCAPTTGKPPRLDEQFLGGTEWRQCREGSQCSLQGKRWQLLKRDSRSNKCITGKHSLLKRGPRAYVQAAVEACNVSSQGSSKMLKSMVHACCALQVLFKTGKVLAQRGATALAANCDAVRAEVEAFRKFVPLVQVSHLQL